jgi:hypothetical protein
LIDLKKVDAKIKMLEAIRQIAADPEMTALLDEVTTDRGAAPPKTLKMPLKPAKKRQTSKPQRGALKAAVLKAARQKQGPFSGYALAEDMLKDGKYKFSAPHPAIAVNDVLRTAAAKGNEIRLHKRGKGSDPNLYENVKPQAEAVAGKGSGD